MKALSCYSDVGSRSVHLQLIIGGLRNDGGKGNDLDNATNHYYDWLKEEATIVLRTQQVLKCLTVCQTRFWRQPEAPNFSFSH